MRNSKGRAIGAKILHDREIEQSLPTYGKLKEQIEAVRPVAADYKQRLQKYAQDEFVMPQVINNFSILGSRGTGKSSILKTLYQYLQAQNTDPTDFKKQKNILLPSIVPENLVDNISLMGCILGLLKETVDRISDTQENHNSFCPSQPCPLKKKYNELMREFVQLQQPYEQISVQQFSTNSEYTRTITSMLEAGNQFTVQFRHFIDELLSEYADDALLFIFIDDIDLSTNRCGDLVKTLLSYLSHPAIVTVLAGDISIFGEALTLDFLHKEKIPDSEYLQNSYLVEKTQYGHDTAEEKMLERKKQLAYEYLKKVMPPNNRHSIVNWSLSSKRNFCIVQDSEENSSVTLADLLDRLDRHIPLLHHYYGEQKDSLLYYPFDTTARGLASSYHAIQMLVEKLDSSHTDNEEIHLDEFYSDIKFLIESVVASSYQLSIHQHLIFKQFLDLGSTLENCSIRFDNFYIWSASTILHTQVQEQTEKTNISATPVLTIKSDIMIFQLFVFLDWTARLLGRNDLFSQIEYQKVKKMMLTSLCTNGYINEGNLYLNKIEQNQFVAISSMSACPLSNILEGYYDLPFPVAIRYFQSFDIPLFLNISQKEGKNISHEIYREYAIEYIEVLKFYYSEEGSKEKGSSCLGQYIKEHPKMLDFLENELNYSPNNLMLSTLCQEYFYSESLLYKYYIVSGCQYSKNTAQNEVCFDLNSISDDYLRKQTVESIPDTVTAYINSLPFQSNNTDQQNTLEQPDEQNTWKQYIYKEWLNFVTPSAHSSKLIPFYNAYLKYITKFFETNGKLAKLNEHLVPKIIKAKEYKQISIIMQIDEKNLWNIDHQFLGEENFISIIVKYITEKLKKYEKRFMPKFLPLKICISTAQNAYQTFQNIYHGVSNTVAAKCKKNLRKILQKDSFETGITTIQYMACILILNRLIYSSAWYGKEEARVLKTQLESCECDLFNYVEHSVSPQDINQYAFWLHCYCRYQAVHLTDSMYITLDRASNAMQSIRDSITANEKFLKSEYVDMFADKLGMTRTEVEMLPKLFELPKEGSSNNDNT